MAPQPAQPSGSQIIQDAFRKPQFAASGGTFGLDPTQQAYTNLLQTNQTAAGNPAATNWTSQYGTGQSAGTYGAGNPYTFQFNQYDPATLGSQPFIKKLQGTQEANEFQGFGAQLSNPSLGLSNIPWAVNLKTLLRMNPSEQDQTASLYKQGLGVDFRDVVEQARRAAPIGTNFGVAGYGGR